VQALAQALTTDGYAASAEVAPAGGGQQLCQHHCPVAHVAAQFPQLCEAETEAFGRLLGTPVQRLATIAHGDGVCTTHITDLSLVRPSAAVPPPSARPAAAARPRRAPHAEPSRPHRPDGTALTALTAAPDHPASSEH
jgi:hypothetical protein